MNIYTTSSLFLRTLARCRITHAFVNWGSDHPALLEDLERQRVEQRTQGIVATEEEKNTTNTQPTIITCPNEMVALSAAQGFAQATGIPAAVIVHVDVGTQALAGAIHNVDRNRTPVLIYAGASPFSAQGELKGSRNEWIMWMQDIPDQPAILRQYMRHTAQISSAKTVEKTVKRALQIATSAPKGPVYLWARREVMEEVVNEDDLESVKDMKGWPAIESSGLSPHAIHTISRALLEARSPVILTSHIGRNPSSLAHLSSLSSLLSIPVVAVCPSAVALPFSHPSNVGVTFLSAGTHWEGLHDADVILVLECDLPWIPVNGEPSLDARVFVIDGGDPLKLGIGYSHVDVEMICRADPGIALTQIENALRRDGVRPPGENWVQNNTVSGLSTFEEAAMNRRHILKSNHASFISKINADERLFARASNSTTVTVPNLIGILRRAVVSLTPSAGSNTLYLNESISNYPTVWTHLRPERPGSVISSGGSSLGWALGAAVGATLGGRARAGDGGYELVVVIVGDGSFMFGVPSSAYWMARRYDTPFLTIILNNGGWKSPKLSMQAVHPKGHGTGASGDQLSVGFGPNPPDYAQIAVAASSGWAWGTRVEAAATLPGEDVDIQEREYQKGLENVVEKAIRIVLEERRCAVVDCVLASL